MSNFKLEKKHWSWGLTAFLVIIACIVFYSVIQHWRGIVEAARTLLGILSPFIWGAVLAYLLSPLVRIYQKYMFEPLGMRIYKGDKEKSRKFGRGIAITFALILLLALITILFYLVIPQLYEGVEGLIQNISTTINRLQHWADKSLESYPILDENFSGVLSDLNGSFTTWLKDTLLPRMSDIITSVSTGVISIVRALANAILAVVASIYIMYNREKFVAQLKKLTYSIFSVSFAKKIIIEVRYIDRVFMGFFGGQIIDSMIVAVITYIGSLIIGIKDPVLIAVIIGVTNVIPVFGPFIGAVPSALIVLMYSPVKCFIFVVFIIVLQQFDGNVLVPKIVGSKTGLSGFWVLFAIIVTAGLIGPVGMIIGVPLFAVLAAAIKSLAYSRLRGRGLSESTDDYENLKYIDPKTNQAVLIRIKSKDTESGNNSEKKDKKA